MATAIVVFARKSTIAPVGQFLVTRDTAAAPQPTPRPNHIDTAEIGAGESHLNGIYRANFSREEWSSVNFSHFSRRNLHSLQSRQTSRCIEAGVVQYYSTFFFLLQENRFQVGSLGLESLLKLISLSVTRRTLIGKLSAPSSRSEISRNTLWRVDDS